MNPLSALIIGYGSIGRRHAEILQKMDMISNVAICTSQFDIPYETIRSLEEIPKLNPDYIVISSNTSSHKKQLMFLEENLIGKNILVEKPLFDSFDNLEINKNQVFVDYNLHFHPLLIKIKEKISYKHLWNIDVFCGSYLPEWRPRRDYRETTSAKKGAGGGVLLELSHELDYVRWIAGALDVEHVQNCKVSDLEIETDDLLLFTGRSERCPHVHISLNYFTRRPMRQILIDGECISIQADLIANTASVYEHNNWSEFSWPQLQRNDTYLAQHKAIINGDFSNVCTYKEGLETMRLIDSIRSFNSR